MVTQLMGTSTVWIMKASFFGNTLEHIVHHFKSTIDLEGKIIFVPSSKEVGAIQYDDPNHSTPETDPILDFEKALKDRKDRIRGLKLLDENKE